MAKTGRNDPCPCGSGRKYKHCCYAKESAQSSSRSHRKEIAQFIPPESYAKDPEWLRIRKTEGEVVPAILEFARSRYGKEFFEDALAEFGMWGDYEVDEIHCETMFFPWLAFNWIPETDQPESTEEEPPPLGLEYLEGNARALNEYQRAFIREACAQPYSFFVITDVCAGESLGVRDIFLGRTSTVKEAAASKQLRPGDIIFSRIVELEGQAIMLGMAPTILPPNVHHLILDSRDDFKKKLRKRGVKLDKHLLLEFDLEMREIYFELAESVSRPPELRNTDGERLSFVKLYFKLRCTPEEALSGLKSLTLPEFQDGILADADFDASGNLREVAFSWQKRSNKTERTWNNTILGTVRIKGDTLTAEVNSQERAEKIKSEIAKRLENRAAFQNAANESLESKLEQMEKEAGSPASEERRKESEELKSRPEVQELIKRQLEAHWEGWYNTRLPALSNKTPLQAARTKAGRERLEALLLEFERHNERASDPYLRVDLAGLRKRLGL